MALPTAQKGTTVGAMAIAVWRWPPSADVKAAALSTTVEM
jgi:hypothetical protein